jgi:phosphoribosylamine---glycine ligase
MNIALIGSGGREHAICQKLYESPLTKNIYCIPGNAGTEKIAKNLNFDPLNFKKLLIAVRFYKIDLVVIGPELPLTKGIVDFFQTNNINIFGPNKYAAQLEGSKAFMKNICKKFKIPTAAFKICKNKTDVKKFLINNKLPIVVKADGLAAGKGVVICKTYNEVEKFSNEIFKGKFKSSKKLVLEEFLSGEEASYFLIVDKKSFAFFGSAQDHKRVRENEKGPNTGGMGAYSPAQIINKDLEKKIIQRIIEPTLKALKSKNNPYTGFLYAGLMIKNNNPYLIEYNVRMGDPECQAILPRLDTDLVKILKAATDNQINKIKINWKNKKCMTTVLCSRGYPGSYKNSQLPNIDNLKLSKNSFIFHAGTKLKNNLLFSNGGRVLNITEIGNNFSKIRKNILNNIKKINWKKGFFRKDIGWRVIKNIK